MAELWIVVALLDSFHDSDDLCLELTFPRAEIYDDIIHLQETLLFHPLLLGYSSYAIEL